MDLQGGPTFEDLSIDDELTQLQRLVRYSGSSIALQRLVHVKMLSETVAAVGFEQAVKSVVPLLAPLAEDQELVVRQHLGEQLEEIAKFCKLKGKEAGYRLIIEIILPTLAKLLGDSQAEVRQAAGESLVGVANLMKPIDLGHHVLTIVLQLAHDDEQEELRMTAAALLNDLAEALGYDLCKQFVTPEMESLSEDPVFRVRKATALNLDKICKVVGDAGITRLLPAFVRLAKDDVYRVRKACTEALVEMSKAVGAEVSLRDLTPVFHNLASDSSKLVRTGALQHLGRFISTLPGDSVSEDLVSYFTGTAVESMGDPVADAELRLYCAFSFPAVVITIGPDRWHELRESFAALIRDPSWSVRKTLSFSLHEIAKVLRPDDVEQDLVPAMEVFLRDMEDVRLGIIRQLAEFFREMTPEQREKHLNVLVEILQTTSPFNWRLREVLAQQLPRLAPLLTPDSVFFAVVPVAFGLLNDPVSVVREKTFEVVAPLLQLAGAHSGARQASMVSRVRELAHAPTYQARQMYVYICLSMACSANVTHAQPLFVQEFVPSLSELATDSVVNVRIAMSRALSKCPDWVMELPEIRRAIHHLVKDSNPDVRHFVSFLPPILRNDLAQEEKQPPGQETSSVLSDESVLTQWSVSTQRSMLSVGDFPPTTNASSPSGAKSIKIGRQRSSSVESVGESGYSTTSEEGEGLKRLTSRRPPLPAGWGLPAVSSGEPTGGGGDGAESVGSGGSDSGSSGTTSSPSAEVKTTGFSSVQSPGGEDRRSGSPRPPPPGEDLGWGSGGGSTRGEARGSDDEQHGGALVSSEADALMFGMQAAAAGTAEAREGGEGDEEQYPYPAVPPSPRRAASQDSAVMEDDVDEGVREEEVDALLQQRGLEETGGDEEGPSSAALSAKFSDLTLSPPSEGLADKGRRDGALPPSPLSDGRGGPALRLASPVVVRQGPTSGMEATESPATWGSVAAAGESGPGRADPEAALTSGEGVAEVEGDEGEKHPVSGAAVVVVGGYPQERSGLNLTPPPWEESEMRGAVTSVSPVPSPVPLPGAPPSPHPHPPSPPCTSFSSLILEESPDAADAATALLLPDEVKKSESDPSRWRVGESAGGDGRVTGSTFPDDGVPREIGRSTTREGGGRSAMSAAVAGLGPEGGGVGWPGGQGESRVTAPAPPSDGFSAASGRGARESVEQPTIVQGAATATAAATTAKREEEEEEGEEKRPASSRTTAARGAAGAGAGARGVPSDQRDGGAVLALEASCSTTTSSTGGPRSGTSGDPELAVGAVMGVGGGRAGDRAGARVEGDIGGGLAAMRRRQGSGVIEDKYVEPGGGHKEDVGDDNDAWRTWSKE